MHLCTRIILHSRSSFIVILQVVVFVCRAISVGLLLEPSDGQHNHLGKRRLNSSVLLIDFRSGSLLAISA
jgi:hypothetical protein